MALVSAAAGFIAATLLWKRSSGGSGDAEYRTLVENSPTGVAVVYQDRVVFANRQLLQTVAGGDEARVVGRTLSQILAPPTLIDAQQGISHVIESGEPIFLQNYLARGHNGVEARCDIRMVPVVFGKRNAVQVSFILAEEKSRAVDALHRTEERFRRFFDEMPVPMYRTRPDGEIVHANKALADMLGVPDPAELIGVNAAVFYGEEGERQRLAKLQTESGFLDGQLSLLMGADGRKVYVRDSSRTVAEGDDQVFEGVLVDVTAGHLAAQELEVRIRQQQAVAQIGRTALASTDIGALLQEAAERIRDVLNIAVAGVLLAEDGHALGAKWVAPGTEPTFRSVRDWLQLETYASRALEASKPVVLPGIPAEGDEQAIVGLAVPIPGSTESLGVIAIDSAALSADDENFLISMAATLGSAVERSRARDRLETLVRSKDEFVASVSHELRTPLTVVAGLALELENKWREFNPSEIAEFVELIADQSREMGDLIEDLLVAARADIGKVAIHLEAVDLRDSIDQVVGAFGLADRARIAVSGDATTARCDPVRFRQVIRNLLTNAVRYGGPSIRVTVARSAERASVTVFDDGVGIPEESRDAIFEAYQRAHPAGSVPGSVGLGLTVSRKLAALMDGSISYRYEDGSVFELTLPTAMPPEPPVVSPLEVRAP